MPAHSSIFAGKIPILQICSASYSWHVGSLLATLQRLPLKLWQECQPQSWLTQQGWRVEAAIRKWFILKKKFITRGVWRSETSKSFRSRIHHLMAVCSWGIHLPSLLTCRVGRTVLCYLPRFWWGSNAETEEKVLYKCQLLRSLLHSW